jgi:hypothetical protein
VYTLYKVYFFFMWSLLGYDRIAEHLCKFHANLVAGGAGGGGKWSGKGGKVGAVCNQQIKYI